MSKISNVADFRRTLAAACLVLAPILFGAAELLSPPQPNDPNQLLASIALYHDRDYLSRILSFGAFLLFIPAIFAVIRLLSRRGVALGHTGGALTLFGIMTNTVLIGLGLALDQMVAPGLDRGSMAALVNSLGQSPAFGVLMIGHEIFALGIVLLGIGLWRSGVVPRWAGICVAVAPLLDAALGTAGLGDSPLLGIVTSALLVIGLAGVSWSLLAASGEERDAAAERDTRVITA